MTVRFRTSGKTAEWRLVAARSMGRCNTIYGNVDRERWCLWYEQDDPGSPLGSAVGR
jgi:hypothetical protein